MPPAPAFFSRVTEKSIWTPTNRATFSAAGTAAGTARTTRQRSWPSTGYSGHPGKPEACKKEGIRSILSIPLVFKDNVIGMLRLYDTKERDYTYREVEFITALAEQGAIAIENARYMEKVLKDHKKEVEELSDWFNAMAGTTMLDG